ncbi:MAG: hypothetical protein AAF642_18475, partial [Pseudomonadota bacterium]
MSEMDPNIPKLLNIKQKAQERRLAEILGEKRDLEQKLADLTAEVAAMDMRTDGYDQISVANGYLKYVQHRKEALIRQIEVLNEQAETVQNQLRKS